MKEVKKFVRTLSLALTHGKGRVQVRQIETDDGVLKVKLKASARKAPFIVGRNGQNVKALEQLATVLAKKSGKKRVIIQVSRG